MGMVGKVVRNTKELIIYVKLGLCRTGVLTHHVCIVFSLNQPIRMFEFPNCSRHGWITDLQHCDWLIARKYNTHVMSKDPHSCIKLNKNMDNEFYCISNDFLTIPFYKL